MLPRPVAVFAKYCEERSDCGSYKQGGDLGEFGPGDMQSQFEEGCRCAHVLPTTRVDAPARRTRRWSSLTQPAISLQGDCGGQDVGYRPLRLGVPHDLPHQVSAEGRAGDVPPFTALYHSL